MNLVPGLSLRVSAEEEEVGLDDGELGEFAYDYVEITRNIESPSSHSSPAESIKGGEPEKSA